MNDLTQPIWQPDSRRREASRMRAYQDWLEREKGLRFSSYEEMWRWSVAELETFWETIWEFFSVR